jgi:hypothetical protein
MPSTGNIPFDACDEYSAEEGRRLSLTLLEQGPGLGQFISGLSELLA